MSIKLNYTDFFKGIKDFLDERSLRYVTAVAAESVIGYGGVTEIAKLAGISRSVIYDGKKEILELRKTKTSLKTAKGVRRKGAGRKQLTCLQPELKSALESLIEPYVRGDPESPLLWTTKSLRKLEEEMRKKGFRASYVTIGSLLEEMGYTLQSCRKSHEGGDNEDRNAQFEHIYHCVKSFQEENFPVISVDAKKKELIGNFKNNGRERHVQGEPPNVEVYDFINENGRATPYGIYDLSYNEGFVNVSISHDTASFAVDSIRRWWETMGKKRYPESKVLLINADGGGSNGSRNKLWKIELQKFANDYDMDIYVTHFPPGTSKWNKIEHRMFSYISMNWRGRPLETLEIIVNLIQNTSTKTGLVIKSEASTGQYKTGETVTDEQVKKLNIMYYDFHPEWNYLIRPQR